MSTHAIKLSFQDIADWLRVVAEGDDRPKGAFDSRSDPWLGGAFTCHFLHSSSLQQCFAPFWFKSVVFAGPLSANRDRETPVPAAPPGKGSARL